MTTAQASFAFSNTSAANAKVWIDGVKNLLLSAGLVQTSDTGQLDTTTVTGSGSNQNYGFHVFKFPDSMQSTTPIFIRLNYYSTSNTYAGIEAVVGVSTNGTGTVPSVITFGFQNAGSLNPLTSYACYVDGTFGMVLGYAADSASNANNCVRNLVIDRTRDTSGNATSNGFLAEGAAANFGTTNYSRSYYGSASPAQNNNFIPAMIPSINAVTTAEGPNVNVFRHYSMTPGVRPHLGMLTYFNAELGALTPFTATVLGSNHTYLPMGYAMNYWSSNPKLDHCCAIRWE